MSEISESSRPHQQPMNATSIAFTLLTVALWGGGPVAIRYSVDTLPPVMVAGLRFAMASGFMLLWCGVQRTSLGIQKRELLPIAILSGLLFVQISLFNLGIQWANASHGTLFINTFIFWVAGIEHFITRNSRLSGMKGLGLVLAASGVALIMNVDRVSLRGDLALMISGMILGIKIVYTKYATQIVAPARLIFWHDVGGTILFFLWSSFAETVSLSDFTEEAVWGLVYQGVAVAGLCFALQAELLKKHAASDIAVYSFATPLFGIVLAVLLRGEAFTQWLFVSGILVALGILLVNLSSRLKR